MDRRTDGSTKSLYTHTEGRNISIDGRRAITDVTDGTDGSTKCSPFTKWAMGDD